MTIFKKIVIALCAVVGAFGASFGATVSVSSVEEFSSALASAAEDDVVEVAAGSYSLPAAILIDKGITVRSAGDGETIFISSDVQKNCFELNHPGARLEGVTLLASQTNTLTIIDGIASNLVFRKSGKREIDRDVVVVFGGVFTDSVMTNITERFYWMYDGITFVRVDGGLVKNCFFGKSHNYAETVLHQRGGVVSNCTFTAFSSDSTAYQHSVAVLESGLMTHCFVTNTGSYKCAIVAGLGDLKQGYGQVTVKGDGILRNCFFKDNRGELRCGIGVVSANARVENCTVIGADTDPYKSASGAALYMTAGTVVNSIFYGNKNHSDRSVYKTGGTMLNCWRLSPLVGGEGNVTGDNPLFNNEIGGDFSPALLSPCFDGGTNLCFGADGVAIPEGAGDLALNKRVRGGRVDIGAYEAIGKNEGDLRCDFNSASGSVFSMCPVTISFTGDASGRGADGASFLWDMDGDGEYDDATGKEISYTFDSCGMHDVSLRVVSADGSYAMVCAKPGYITVIDTTAAVYVNPNGLQESPFDTPEKGFKSLTAALDFFEPVIETATARPTIYLVPGRHPIKETLWLVDSLLISGSPECAPGNEAILYCDGCTKLFNVGSSGVEFRSLTIEGATETFTIPFITMNDGVVSNCVLRCESGHQLFGPMIELVDGVVMDSVFSNAVERFHWDKECFINMTGGEVRGCLFTDSVNFGEIGVYQSGGVMTNCVFRGLKPSKDLYQYSRACLALTGGLATHCVFTNNGSASCGNLVGAPGTVFVGGTGILRNCLIADNDAYNTAGIGIADSGIVENCTVYGNRCSGTSSRTGDDLYMTGGQLINSIVWGNPGADDGGVYYFSGTVAGSVVAAGVTSGNGNIVGIAPVFVDPGASNYRPDLGCVGIDGAATRDWMTGAKDLAGRDRIIGKAPDIGAFEADDMSNAFFVSIVTENSTAFPEAGKNGIFTLTPLCNGVSDGDAISYAWYLDDAETPFSRNKEAELTLPCGSYTVKLMVKKGDDVRYAFASLEVYGDTVYVSKFGSETYPFDTWEKATHSLNTAYAALNVPGDKRTRARVSSATLACSR